MNVTIKDVAKAAGASVATTCCKNSTSVRS